MELSENTFDNKSLFTMDCILQWTVFYRTISRSRITNKVYEQLSNLSLIVYSDWYSNRWFVMTETFSDLININNL